MRKNLKEARRKAGMTQKEVADHLGITIRSYQRIENGELLGSICHWDTLEDLFKIHQKKLRLIAGGANMKKIDKKVDLLKKLQAEIDRRTQVENEAISLISSGEHEKARELLESLDDQIVKDIEAELDQEPEEETDVAETGEYDELAKQFLRAFLLDVWSHLVVALQQKDIASFEWVIQRHAKKLLKLQKGR